MQKEKQKEILVGVIFCVFDVHVFVVNFLQKSMEKRFSTQLFVHAPKCCNGGGYIRKKRTYTFVLSVKPSANLKLL